MCKRFLLTLTSVFLALNIGYAQEPASEEVDLIAPDRPGFGDAVSIAPQGQLMLETGIMLEQEHYELGAFSTNLQAITFNNTLLRYGVNERIELRFDYNIYSSGTHLFLNNYTDGDGLGLLPCRLGMKANLLKNKGWIPDATFIGMIGMPWTATSNYRPAAVSPNLQISFASPITEILTLCYLYGLGWNGGNPNPQNYYAISTEFAFNDHWGAYAQGRGFVQKYPYGWNFSDVYQHNFYLEGGLMYYPKKHIQIDISGGFKAAENWTDNLTPVTPNKYFFLTAGLSWRFGDK